MPRPAAIEYVERPPGLALRHAVRALWSLDGHLPAEVIAVPKPCVELVVSLGEPHLWRPLDRDPAAAVIARDGWITPIQSGPRVSRALGRSLLIGARLELPAAHALFGRLPLGDGAIGPSLDGALGADGRRLRALGGAPVVGPVPLPDGRAFAWFKDPDGTVLGLISSAATADSP
jgi:hypothetical protein